GRAEAVQASVAAVMGTLHEGDWVKATKPLRIGLLGGGTIRAGTKGVVTAVERGLWTARAAVAFDGGFGTVRATVPTRHLGRVRSGGGVDRFHRRQRHVAAARAGFALFLAWPVISWCIQYIWINKGFTGITGAFAIGIVQSAEDWI